MKIKRIYSAVFMVLFFGLIGWLFWESTKPEVLPTGVVPHGAVHVMETSELEHFAGRAEGDYARDVEGVYLGFQRAIGACFIDQYIPDNPLSMTPSGYDSHTQRGPTTGA